MTSENQCGRVTYNDDVGSGWDYDVIGSMEVLIRWKSMDKGWTKGGRIKELGQKNHGDDQKHVERREKKNCY